MTGKPTPSAVLVIQNGTTKLVNIKNQDGLTKVLDMVPDFVDRFSSGFGKTLLQMMETMNKNRKRTLTKRLS